MTIILGFSVQCSGVSSLAVTGYWWLASGLRVASYAVLVKLILCLLRIAIWSLAAIPVAQSSALSPNFAPDT